MEGRAHRDDDVSDAEVRQAIAIELHHILPKGWSFSQSAGGFLVRGLDAPDFRANVWRIAEFLAYDAFLSIERTEEAPREYTVVSRSTGDLKFRVVIRAEQRSKVPLRERRSARIRRFAGTRRTSCRGPSPRCIRAYRSSRRF